MGKVGQSPAPPSFQAVAPVTSQEPGGSDPCKALRVPLSNNMDARRHDKGRAYHVAPAPSDAQWPKKATPKETLTRFPRPAKATTGRGKVLREGCTFFSSSLRLPQPACCRLHWPAYDVGPKHVPFTTVCHPCKRYSQTSALRHTHCLRAPFIITVAWRCDTLVQQQSQANGNKASAAHGHTANNTAAKVLTFLRREPALQQRKHGRQLKARVEERSALVSLLLSVTPTLTMRSLKSQQGHHCLPANNAYNWPLKLHASWRAERALNTSQGRSRKDGARNYPGRRSPSPAKAISAKSHKTQQAMAAKANRGAGSSPGILQVEDVLPSHPCKSKGKQACLPSAPP